MSVDKQGNRKGVRRVGSTRLSVDKQDIGKGSGVSGSQRGLELGETSEAICGGCEADVWGT